MTTETLSKGQILYAEILAMNRFVDQQKINLKKLKGTEPDCFSMCGRGGLQEDTAARMRDVEVSGVTLVMKKATAILEEKKKAFAKL